MPLRGRMSELASFIQTHTSNLEEYLISQSQPLPSLGADGTDAEPLPQQLDASREIILESIDELQGLVLGPLDHLMRLTTPHNLPISLQLIYRFNIANKLAMDEEVSYAELARRCGLSVSNLKRLLRLAVAHDVFCEPREDIVGHTAVSKYLAQIPVLHQWNGWIVEEMWPASTRTVDAMMQWPGSEEPRHTGFRLANDSEGSFWDALEENQERTDRFTAAMQVIQSAPMLDPSILLDNIQWTDNCPELIVDVGGSHGSIACKFLRKYPKLRAVVQDKDEVIAKAQVPSDLEGRLMFRAHNFFDEQPIKGADVYFFRSVIHDWPDKYALRILRSLIPAMKPGARVILNEVCLPEPGVLSHYQERQIRGYDVSMMYLFNSKERDADEWVKLLKEADPRFGAVKINSPPRSMLSIIETTWQEAA